jgi:hypothetical protein
MLGVSLSPLAAIVGESTHFDVAEVVVVVELIVLIILLHFSKRNGA